MDDNGRSNIRLDRRTSGINTAPTTPAFHSIGNGQSPLTTPIFKFPAEPSSPAGTPPTLSKPLKRMNSGATPRAYRALSPRPQDPWNELHGGLAPISRVLSEVSANDSHRSSSDFYSMSNHSNETVGSEMPFRATQGRQSSQYAMNGHSVQAEHLMMGYAQTIGSFSLDGSLINQAPFEEVKRKGIVGGQGGGGVVGVERSKRESGMFGAFGWGNIGESIGGLLGMDEMSSMKDMRNLASSKTIPLLSTPQSILFVDLRLSPGESKSYTYKFRIPTGLPPSHKGRSIRVQYHLTIGVQRPGGLSQQKDVKHVDVPFRVLGSVNSERKLTPDSTRFH